MNPIIEDREPFDPEQTGKAIEGCGCLLMLIGMGALAFGWAFIPGCMI